MCVWWVHEGIFDVFQNLGSSKCCQRVLVCVYRMWHHVCMCVFLCKCWKVDACCYVTCSCMHKRVCALGIFACGPTPRLLIQSRLCLEELTATTAPVYAHQYQQSFGEFVHSHSVSASVWACVLCVCGRGFTAHLYVVFTALWAKRTLPWFHLLQRFAAVVESDFRGRVKEVFYILKQLQMALCLRWAEPSSSLSSFCSLKQTINESVLVFN